MLSSDSWPKMTMQTLAKFPHVKIPGNSLTLYDVSPLTFSDVSMAASAGGLITTPSNLIRWYHFLLRGAYLSKYSLQELTATIPSHKGVGYGLGVTVRQLPQFHDEAISHDGSLNGFRANIIYLKHHEIMLALTTNSANDAIELNTPLLNKIISLLINARKR